MLRKLVLVLVLGAILVASGQFEPKTVQAGTNGQQLRFNCAFMDYAVVKGYNNYGQFVTWPSSGAAWAPGGFALSGWWWKGTVYVYYRNRNTQQWSRQSFTVPQYQAWSDWYYAGC